MPVAVVLLSGGLDSSTCVYWAHEKGYDVLALSVDYGQRHRIELNAARSIAQHARVYRHIEYKIDFGSIGHSALTDDIDVPKGGHDIGKNIIPVTYVPARNLILLSFALAFAEVHEAEAVVIGVNALDYSGYPDCRPDFIESFRKTSALATRAGREGVPIKIITPLIHLSKRQIMREALRLNVPVDMTWSCYDPKPSGSGYVPCGDCDSCLLRQGAIPDDSD